MKIVRLLLVFFVLSQLSACLMDGPVSLKNPLPSHSKEDDSYKLSPNHWSDVTKVKNQANRLALRIKSGEITKVQVAEELNDYRLKVVGSNTVDDSVYHVYYNAALDSQKGLISSEQSKNLIIGALKDWKSRWSKLPLNQKPRNPAFTNFLMETMGLDPLN